MATSATSSETYGQWAGEPASYAESEDGVLFGFNLRRIIAMIRRNIVWIAAIMVVTIAAAVVLTLLTTPVYTASSSVLVEEAADQIIEGSDLQPVAANYDTERFLKTQVDVIRSRLLAERVVANEKLAADDKFFAAMGTTVPPRGELTGTDATPAGYAEMRKDMAVGLIRSGLSVDLPSESRVITIFARSNSPAMAARIANAYAEAFIQSTLERKFESSSYARRFLAGQLEESRSRLEASERELNLYSRAAGLIRVSGQGEGKSSETALSVTNDSLMQLNGAASVATADRVAAQDRWLTISKEPVLSIPQVLQSNAIQQLIQQRSEAQAKLAEERVKHLDDYPTVISLRAQISEVDARIQSVGNSIKRSIYLDYEAAKEKEQSLLDRVSELRSTALTEQDRGVQYNLLKRVADTNRSTYDTLLERYNQLSATAGAASNNVSLVDHAEIPGGPSSPKLLLNLMVAIVLGTILAAALVILRDYFDDTIRSPDDVEQKLGLPLLGLIPRSDDASAELQDSKSSISEAYHSLVTNLNYSTPTGLPKVLAVTSGREGEGKTTTSYAIAVDLARLGRRVLLIDSDLRRPTLHGRLGDRREGLTAVLSGQAALDDVVFTGEDPNLSFMTALPIPSQPSILLGGPNLAKVVKEAASRFDVVVFDCPPMLGLSDTATIATFADAVVLMVDASEFHRGSVKSAIRRLRLIKASLAGVVLSKFDPKTSGNEYSYYGYSYYQYGRDGSA